MGVLSPARKIFIERRDSIFKIAIYTDCTTLYSSFFSTNDLHSFTRHINDTERKNYKITQYPQVQNVANTHYKQN